MSLFLNLFLLSFSLTHLVFIQSSIVIILLYFDFFVILYFLNHFISFENFINLIHSFIITIIITIIIT